MAEKKEKIKNLYPHFVLKNNDNPNRVLNFPIFGIIVKVISIIPQGIELFFLYIASFFMLVINWFIVLFTGKYWDEAYRFFVSIMRLETKIAIYLYGLTDKYPGFALNTGGLFELDIEKPESPNRWLSIPFIGVLARLILMIPYFIFSDVLQKGSGVAVLISWFTILFKKTLPESLYEFERDSLRVSNASSAYLLGLKDKYPSFYISMDHQTAKILLILAGAILSFSNWSNSSDTNKKNDQYRYEYGANSQTEELGYPRVIE